MEFLPRQFLFGVCAIAMAIGLASGVHGEAAPVVVGLARCADCTRKNMNAEAAFKGLQVAVKCKNSKGEYESKAVGQLDKSGAFSVPLAADLVGEDGQLKQDCFAQLHSASSTPCPGQEPSKIVAAQPSHGSSKMTFVALAGKVHEPSAECSSAYLCHAPVVVPPKPEPKPKPDHDHPHPPKDDHDHDHDHAHPPVAEPPKPPKPTPIYHPPSKRNAATDPQLFKKMLPFLKKPPFFPPAKQIGKP